MSHEALGEWTTEPPTKPGYYWRSELRLAPAIVEVVQRAGGLYVLPEASYYGQGWFLSNRPNPDFQWAGPIAVPPWFVTR